MVDTTALQTAIITDLTAELGNEESFNATLLATKVKLAIKEAIQIRHYENTNFTDSQILADLDRHYTTITNLARYDYNQAGAEGQNAHTENSVARSYVSRASIVERIRPFCKVLF